MRSITATLLAGVLVLSAQQPVGQQPPAQTVENAPKGGAKFSTSTQLVVEDLILKDKSGNAIMGLKASDFVVLEDGKPQKIEFVEFQNLEEAPVPMPEPALEKRGPTGEKPAPAPKPVTANQIAPEKPGDIK